MTIRQIDFTEAMKLVKTDVPVFVITNPNKPVLKSFNKLTIGDAISNGENFIYVVFEEAVESGRS